MTSHQTSSRPARTNLREAHAHIAQHGRMMSMVDLSSCTSQSDALGRLASRAQTTDSNDWIIASGARPQGWAEGDWFALTELDDAVGGRAACVWCFDQHAIQASSAALRVAGIDNDTPDPPHGMIGRSDGALTGVVLEAATGSVWAAVPEPSLDERREQVRASLTNLAALGYVEIHEMKAQSWLGSILHEIEAAGELGQSISLYATLDVLDGIIESRSGWESDRIHLAGGKIFTDGTLNSRTAHMLHPFTDGLPDHPHGTPMMTPAEIEHAITRCDSHGLALAMHAIGDAAVRSCLDAVEAVKPSTSGFRIEHCEVIDEEDVQRFAQLGVIASVQPCHLLPDIEALNRFCPDRLDRVLPLREMLDSGAEVYFGSDVPIVRADPVDSIRAATQRRRTDMPPESAIAPNQAITEHEAWQALCPSSSHNLSA